jgi:hypothetical protein
VAAEFGSPLRLKVALAFEALRQGSSRGRNVLAV